MSDFSAGGLDSNSIKEHPVFVAWKKLEFGGSPPIEIERLTTKKGRKPVSKKATLYRLRGVGKNGSDVIAKNSRRQSILNDRYVYQEILPELPLTNLHYYGFVKDKDSSFWLFLEDAGGEDYTESVSLHRTLASKWLATLHGTTEKMNLTKTLPPIRAMDSLYDLQMARKDILDNINNPLLRSNDVPILKSILERCDALERIWDSIVKFCSQIPPCLVHHDFIKKNVRVRIDNGNPRIFVFDWERVSWGIRAQDMAGLDAVIYWKTIRKYEHEGLVDLLTVRKLEIIGRIFRCLDWISGTSQWLSHPWIESTMQDLKNYEIRLSQTTSELEFM